MTEKIFFLIKQQRQTAACIVYNDSNNYENKTM